MATHMQIGLVVFLTDNLPVVLCFYLGVLV